jgi:hypothetical protein
VAAWLRGCGDGDGDGDDDDEATGVVVGILGSGWLSGDISRVSSAGVVLPGRRRRGTSGLALARHYVK